MYKESAENHFCSKNKREYVMIYIYIYIHPFLQRKTRDAKILGDLSPLTQEARAEKAHSKQSRRLSRCVQVTHIANA